MVKLLTFYSESHKGLYDEYFLKSYNELLSDDFELVDLEIDQLSESGSFGSHGFEETMIYKIQHIISNIDIESDDLLVYADCDINFYRKDILDDLTNLINSGDNDILFQDDVSCLCAGFFVTKQTDKVKKFFQIILDNLKLLTIDGVMKSGISDQIIINHLYKDNNGSIVNIGKLPKRYFTVASSNHGCRQWTGGDFDTPSDIAIHHGNWTVGLDNKFKIMEYVRVKVNN